MTKRSLHFTTKSMLQTIGVKIVDYDEFWDLGAATNPRHAVGTIGYRAPEIILRMAWSTPIDIFAFAMTIGELYLGRPMFPPSTVVAEQLAILQHVVGHFSIMFIHEAVLYGSTSFNRGSESVNDARNVLEKLKASQLKHISAMIRRPDLQDLLRLCLKGDADGRLLAQEAIEHRYFRRW